MRVSRPGPGRERGVAARPATDRRQPGDRPQRSERVVGDLAGPDEVPQRGEQLVVGACRARPRAAGPRSSPPLGRGRGGWRRGACPVGVVLRLPPGGEQRRAGRRSRAAPDRRSSRSPRRRPTPRRRTCTARRAASGGTRATRADSTSRSSVEATIGAPASTPSASTTASTAAALRRHAVPRRQEPGERLRLDRLDLASQRRPASAGAAGAAPRRRTTPAARPRDGTRRGRCAPSASSAASARATRDSGTPKRHGDLALGERTVRAGVAGDEVLERARHGVGERDRAARAAARSRGASR